MLARVVVVKQLTMNSKMVPIAVQNPGLYQTRQFHSSWFKSMFGGKKEEVKTETAPPKDKIVKEAMVE